MATKLIIKESPQLSGKIPISGAKNAILPMMAASLLLKDDVAILNVPPITDVDVMCRILSSVGCKIGYRDETLIINSSELDPTGLDFASMSKIRASCLVLGPLLARTGQATMPFPGGCKIGARPIDLHVSGLKEMGAAIQINEEEIQASGKLKSGTINLDFPSVGATENLMTAACLTDGYTKIVNAAREPEIVDLGNFLNGIGAKVYGHGTDTIIIEGVKALKSNVYEPIPDRIEAGTFLLAGAVTGGDLLVQNSSGEHLEALTFKLRQMGAEIRTNTSSMRIRVKERLKGSNIICMPYPAFPTDLQAPMSVAMSIADGDSLIEEKVFNNRFSHVKELRKMGAQIKIEGNIAKIHGKPFLEGTAIAAKDLRGGGALVLAGLAAKGTTELTGVKYIDRGYGKLVEKLQKIGGKIQRE